MTHLPLSTERRRALQLLGVTAFLPFLLLLFASQLAVPG